MYTQYFTAVVTVLKSSPPRTVVLPTDEIVGTIRVTVAVTFVLPARIFFRATAVPAVTLDIVRAAIVVCREESSLAVLGSALEAALTVFVAVAITFARLL